MPNPTPIRLVIFPDAVGLAVLAVELVLVFRWLVPTDDSRLALGIIAYGLLVGCTLYIWHASKIEAKISEPHGWAAAVVGSMFVGAVSFACDIFAGSINHPGLSPIRAGTSAGSPFGFMLTVLICPGIGMVAVASLFRAFLLRERSELEG